MKKPKLKFFKTYLAVIQNSVGTRMFRNFFMESDLEFDATGNGSKSCAFFVSNVLHMFPLLGLIQEPHLTVASALKDMLSCGWHEIDEPKIGAVLIWEKKLVRGNENEHIGFYMGNGQAVSNDYESGSPRVHHWTYGEESGVPARKVKQILWNDRLAE